MRAAAAAAALALLPACGGGSYSTGPGGTNQPPNNGRTVNATAGLAFTPDSLTVAVGDTVTFAFGSVAHNVFFIQPGAPADVPGSNANVAVTRVVPRAGAWRYLCHIHPSMQGVVVAR